MLTTFYSSVFRQMERQQSNTLNTPNVSTNISTGDFKMNSTEFRELTKAVLSNFPQNDLNQEDL
jgi:hypothetical protein